ncbi:MAG: patatin-like phospholipase family protein [Clostridia bacterium]|nr:patatin-like phospholipase family protein [Clostridia bacterium]
MKSYGLVLAGGGGKGAYQIGAWKAMREMAISFEAIAGVSIGSINGALIASDDYEKAVSMWNNISVDKGVNITSALPDPENLFSTKNWGVLFKEFMKNKGFDASPAKQFIGEYISEEKVRKSNIPLAIVTVQLTPEITPLELFTSDIPEGQLIDYLMASADIPLANNIGPEGEKKFLDGGAYDNTPVTLLKRNGYNRLVVVDIANIKGLNHDLDFRNSEIVYIRPYSIDDLGASFDFDSATIARRIEMGYLDTKKAFSLLLGKIYHFEPSVFRAMVKSYGAKAVEQLEELAYALKIPNDCVYSQVRFLTELKIAFEAKREEEKAGMEEKETEKENKYISFFKLFSKQKSENDFQEAIAILDNIVL